ncbi:PucR family transcriptional regulator [Pseudonocardia spinosispora]|uniref:PucR family transcriptional regulator n=1 Tax=Pseudonocardia spinosispora TaxID=103441 RepID=UPI000417160D|nr:helix-turn-helix domain-containing protein [Pseudonocardia spinosispora]
MNTADLVAAVAHDLERQLEQLTADTCMLLIDKIPQLDVPEEDVRELLVASVGANMATAVHILAHHIPVNQIEVPAAAAYYARRLAQRNIPMESLLRAYRLGEARFHQWWMRLLDEQRPDSQLMITALRHTMGVTSAYIDRVSENLSEIYSEEREAWAHRAGASRAVQVRTVLEDESLDTSAAEALTGYRMAGQHLALVVWTPARDTVRRVEPVVQAIVELTGYQPLAVLPDDHTLWAWVSGAGIGGVDPVELEKRSEGARIALGSPADGLAGFRASHRQALNARRVAEIHGDEAGSVTSFADVAVSAFLAADLTDARRWVSDVLGGLAADDEGAAELRRTVLAYLRAGSSLIDAAAELHLHKNTVRYRLRKAEDIRGGRAVTERRLDLEVALLACEHLGRAVLANPRPRL